MLASPLRSPRVIAAAVLAAIAAYGYAAVRGAPGPIAALAGLGESGVDARGGVVVEVKLATRPAAALRRELARVITARLDAEGAVVAIEDVDATTLRLTAAGVLPERADAVASAASMRGELALRAIVERGPLLDAITALGGKHHVEQDVWTTEDGSRHEAPYLAADDRAELAAAIAGLPDDPATQVLIEKVEPGGDTTSTASYRAYVVERGVIIGNDDLETATAGPDPYSERPVVNLSFTRAGGDRFGEWTAAHVGNKLAIVVDGQVTSAPVINGAIRGGKAVITMGAGGAPRDVWNQARALAAALGTHDVLPVATTVRVVGKFDPSAARAHVARLLSALFAALCALAIAFGLARWRGLAPAPASFTRGEGDDGGIRWSAIAPRLAVTVAVPIALALLGHITVPGLDVDAIAGLAPDGDPSAFATITSLGVTPVISAYLLVELAALAIPAWRGRRHAGRDARVPLVSATAALAAALAIVQAWFVADFLVAIGIGDDRWLIVAALGGGVLAFALGAAAIERWGVGNGWSVVLAAPVVEAIARALRHGHAAPLALGLGEGALVALIAVGATRVRVTGPGTAASRLPFGGFAGAAIAPALIAFVVGPLAMIPSFADAAVAIVDRLTQPTAQLFAATVLGGVLAALWSRRLPGTARTAAIVLSIAIASTIASLQLLTFRAIGSQPGLAFALAAATLADICAETRARARGEWRELAHLHDVDAADELLAPGGRFARGLHVRALYRFFAPFVPITIYERER